MFLQRDTLSPMPATDRFAFAAGRRAVFLDRDGTLIHERNYLADPAGVELLPGTRDALAKLRAHGFALVIITNQSGVGRGLMTANDVALVNAALIEQLGPDAVIDAIYICPHRPDADCECRKPLPGLLLRAARELDIDLAASFSIGDKLTDIEAGERAGCRTVLVTTGYGSTDRAHVNATTHVAVDVPAAATWILQQAE